MLPNSLRPPSGGPTGVPSSTKRLVAMLLVTAIVALVLYATGWH